MTGWRGSGPYANVDPAAGQAGGGGGLQSSRLRAGGIRPLTPGTPGGGGGRVPSESEPLTGFGGSGGPGPGALIGLDR